MAHYGGAGNKCVYVALGRINAYVMQYMNFWDICGGDVLVKAQGGTSTEFDFSPLIYDNGNKYAHFSSTIFTHNKPYYKRFTELLDMSADDY